MALVPASFLKVPVVFVVVLIINWGSHGCHGFGTFSFDIHHRFSDHIKGILPVDGLPEKESLKYYTALAHRDRIIRGRRLASSDDQILTFADGNMTLEVSALGFLQYANVSLGTPSLSFLVALDTGSDLFWVPCDCTSCLHQLNSSSEVILEFNIYSPNTSSTSKRVPCSSSLCEQQRGCPATSNTCPYKVEYLSNGTSSTGILIEDILHLETDDNHSQLVDARITMGCGQVQTGSFLKGAAPNGLFGLGLDKLSVPSILASSGLASDSFSMCFGPDGTGRISFGDKGSSDQEETPLNSNHLHPMYNVSVTQVIVGDDVIDLDFTAIFDTGTSFTYLSDPAYTRVCDSFNSQAQGTRDRSDPNKPFEYCYALSSNSGSVMTPTISLAMKGGSHFSVSNPTVGLSDGDSPIYCLGIVKSPDVDIIGHNFMTGYRIVFDREKMVLGWKESDCHNAKESSTQPVRPGSSPAVPPAVAAEPPSYAPEATNQNRDGSNSLGAPGPLTGHSPLLNPCGYIPVLVLFYHLFSHCLFIIL